MSDTPIDHIVDAIMDHPSFKVEEYDLWRWEHPHGSIFEYGTILMQQEKQRMEEMGVYRDL